MSEELPALGLVAQLARPCWHERLFRDQAIQITRLVVECFKFINQDAEDEGYTAPPCPGQV